MDGAKPWWASKGVWGGIVAALCGLLAAFGVLSPEQSDAAQASLPEALAAAGAAVGGLLAVWGRVSAKTKVGKP